MYLAKYIIKKEFIQIRRDRAMMALLLIMPVIQLLILGYVFSSDIKHIQTVICDLDNTPNSRQVVEQIKHSGYFDVAYFDSRENQLSDYLDKGKASIAVVIPAHLSQNMSRNIQTEIQILVDGQDSNTSTIALGYIGGILENIMTERITQQISQLENSFNIHILVPSIRIWYNENLKSSDYMIPGIVVFLLTMVTSLVSAMGLVRERDIGTLEQLLVAPIKKHELLIGKIVPFAVVGLVELGLAVSFAKLWYQIPIVGNINLFVLFILVYLFTTLGVGLFVSASASTQQQAMFFAFFLILFFMVMSGFIFPIENMPKSMQLLSYIDPMRYMMIATREIFIKGTNLRHLYWQGIALVIFGGVIFSFAVMRFRKRMR